MWLDLVILAQQKDWKRLAWLCPTETKSAYQHF